jgi:hypothetical protein
VTRRRNGQAVKVKIRRRRSHRSTGAGIVPCACIGMCMCCLRTAGRIRPTHRCSRIRPRINCRRFILQAQDQRVSRAHAQGRRDSPARRHIAVPLFSIRIRVASKCQGYVQHALVAAQVLRLGHDAGLRRSKARCTRRVLRVGRRNLLSTQNPGTQCTRTQCIDHAHAHRTGTHCGAASRESPHAQRSPHSLSHLQQIQLWCYTQVKGP